MVVNGSFKSFIYECVRSKYYGSMNANESTTTCIHENDVNEVTGCDELI